VLLVESPTAHLRRVLHTTKARVLQPVSGLVFIRALGRISTAVTVRAHPRSATSDAFHRAWFIGSKEVVGPGGFSRG
jgi:hypothetical protein